MRPDEHKKKKNEQYKKKHGIKKQKQETDQVQRKEKPLYKQEPQSVKCEKRNDPSSEDELPIKKFEKRKVRSNWDRYEEEIQGNDREDTLKGADFKHLLQNTATSLAQFRFKDEQIWEEDSDTDENDVSNILSINCDHLLSAVSCVSLHERLGIHSQHFQKKQLEQLKQCAEAHHSNYIKVKGKYAVKKKSGAYEDFIPNISDINVEASKGSNYNGTLDRLEQIQNVETLSDSDLKQKKHFDKVEVYYQPEGLENSNNLKDNLTADVQSSTYKIEKMKPNVDDDLEVLLNSTADVQSSTCKIEKMRPNVDDDLDVLLFTSDKCKDTIIECLEKDTETKKDVAVSNNIVMNKNTVSPDPQYISNLEDQLDELLDLDNVDTVEGLSNAETNIEKSQPISYLQNDSKPPAENLEDWLDSVLDD